MSYYPYYIYKLVYLNIILCFLSPFVYSKALFKHYKRALTVFPYLNTNQKYREEDPFHLLFKTKLKASKCHQ
jgi:hypothetical protein